MLLLAYLQALALVVPFATAAFDAQRFVLAFTGINTVSRMDPIMSPGGLAEHVHVIAGASNFRNILNTPEEQEAAHCSTARLSADKSSYWTPLMYFINRNGTYSAMTNTYRIYYFLDYAHGKLTPFPQGFRMIAGLANRRDPGAQQTFGLSLRTTTGVKGHKQYLPNGTMHPEAPDSLVLSVTFPACGWANQSLDSWDHFSHMAYPVHRGDGDQIWALNSFTCPDTHPIRYPTIKLETMYVLDPAMKEEWDADRSNLILSNGDTTGVTFHADFVSGWTENLLQKAIDQCGPGTPIVHDSLELCAPFRPYLKPGLVDRDCRYEGQVPAEDVGFYRPLDKLPGCNPRWDWDGPLEKPPCTPSEPEPGFVSPNLQYNGPIFNTFPLAIPGVDGDNPETLIPTTGWSNDGIKPKLTKWASSFIYGTKPNNITEVLRGTQAEIDEAAKGGSMVVQLWGQLAKVFNYGSTQHDPTAATAPVNTAQATASNYATTRRTATYQCYEGMPWTGFPCGPGPTSTAEETSTEATQSATTSASSTSATTLSESSSSSASTSSGSSSNSAPALSGSRSSTAPTLSESSSSSAYMISESSSSTASAPSESSSSSTSTPNGSSFSSAFTPSGSSFSSASAPSGSSSSSAPTLPGGGFLVVPPPSGSSYSSAPTLSGSSITSAPTLSGSSTSAAPASTSTMPPRRCPRRSPRRSPRRLDAAA